MDFSMGTIHRRSRAWIWGNTPRFVPWIFTYIFFAILCFSRDLGNKKWRSIEAKTAANIATDCVNFVQHIKPWLTRTVLVGKKKGRITCYAWNKWNCCLCISSQQTFISIRCYCIVTKIDASNYDKTSNSHVALKIKSNGWQNEGRKSWNNTLGY